jgi:hypothetical protein
MTATTRRRALGAIIAAGAVASVPAAAAIASPEHADAELSALQAESEPAEQQYAAACEARAELERACRAVLPPKPQEPASHTLLGYSDEEHAEFTREMEARDLARANSPPEPLSPRFVGRRLSGAEPRSTARPSRRSSGPKARTTS